MSDQQIDFLSYDEAAKLVAAIQEEEDIHQSEKRILTVYNQSDKEICWFDYEETMAAVGEAPAGERKEAVQKYILSRIPKWVLDI
jgi:hypothetical protein